MKWHKLKELSFLLPSMRGRDMVAFCFFLVISAAFWFLSALNDTYEMEIRVPLQLSDVPQNVVITEPLPDTISFTLKDKGFVLLEHKVSGLDRPIRIPFRLYVGKNGRGSVSSNDVQKQFATRLAASTRIMAVKAKHWDFCFNFGANKRVPVILDANLSTKPDYYISSITVTPDTINLYASTKALDSIHTIKTEPLRIDNISESFSQEVILQHIYGSKANPEKVRVNVVCEQLTEVQLIVPITVINAPPGTTVKTFPSRVEVRVAIGVSRSESIHGEQFSVVADYTDLNPDNKSKLPIRVNNQPKGVLKATLKVNSVDYLLEKK